MMSYSLLQPDQTFIFDNLFLGIPEPDNHLSRLFAHRFEATFLTRVLGRLDSVDQIRYEPIFREFLKYAKNHNLSMDWKLGLFFLKWAKNCNLINNIELHSFIVSRAAYRWINTSYRERWVLEISLFLIFLNYLIGSLDREVYIL